MKNIKTAQVVFEEVGEHLFQQGCRSYDGTQCRYNDGVKKCAFGLYITDEMYSPALEGKDVNGCISYWEANNIEYPAFIGCHDQLLRSLQMLHDDLCNWVNTESMQDALKGLANKYNLGSYGISSFKFADR